MQSHTSWKVDVCGCLPLLHWYWWPPARPSQAVRQRRQIDVGHHTCTATSAERRSEMSAGIWAVVADLDEHSRFAKCGDDAGQSLSSEQSGESVHRLDKIWRLPFHQKVCLWRLVLALHGKGQVGRSQHGERPSQPYGPARPHCRAVYHRRCSLVSRDIRSFAVPSRVRSSSAFTSTGSTLACWGRLECPEYGWVWVTQHFGTGTGNSRGRWCVTHRIGPSGPCCQACSGWWTSVDVRSASTSSGSARRRRLT